MARQRIKNVWLKKRYQALTALDVSKANRYNGYGQKYLALTLLINLNQNNLSNPVLYNLKQAFLYAALLYIMKRDTIYAEVIAIHVPIERVCF